MDATNSDNFYYEILNWMLELRQNLISLKCMNFKESMCKILYHFYSMNYLPDSHLQHLFKQLFIQIWELYELRIDFYKRLKEKLVTNEANLSFNDDILIPDDGSHSDFVNKDV